MIHTNTYQRNLKGINVKSSQEDEPYCHVCKKNFTTHWVLKEHMKIHSKERPFICPICGHGFTKKYNLKVHVMVHKKIKPFKCAYCPQSYVANYLLTHHMRKHKHTHGRNSLNVKSVISENITLQKHV